MSLKPILATVGAVGAATLLIVQHGHLRSQRDANTALTARVEQAERAAADSAQRLQALQKASENDPRTLELAKLRGEVSNLRRDAARLKEENATLNSALRQAARAPGRPEDPPTSEMDAVKDRGIARLNYTKQWMLALVLHAEDNSGRLPDALDGAKPYFGPTGSRGLSQAQQEFYGTLNPDQFELTYRGALADLKNPANAIVIREREAWSIPGKPGLSRTYGFADGHSEIHYSEDGKFDEWERERTARP